MPIDRNQKIGLIIRLIYQFGHLSKTKNAHAVKMMLFVTFAAQVCLTLAGFETVYLIWGFLSHRFSAGDAEATASVLAFLCLGLAGWAAQTVISRGFYALGSTWQPTAVGTGVAFCTVPLYILLRQ